MLGCWEWSVVGGDAVGSSGRWRPVGRSALGGVLVESRCGVAVGWVTRGLTWGFETAEPPI
ncbi:hypothetical protein DMP14_01070 [Pseudonocardia sp. Ae707_Ps2]